MEAVYQKVMEKAESLLKNLGVRGIGTNVQSRKLPAVEEQLDTLPMFCLVPADEPEQVKRLTFEGTKEKTYALDVVAITRSKKLLALSANQDPNDDFFGRALWRESVVNLFYDPSIFQMPKVKKTIVVPGKPIEREKVNQLYDYSNLTVRVTTLE